MKKIRNIVLGGIQQKVFNLVLFVIILMMAAYTAVIIHQAGRIGSLVTETNEKQKQSISATSQMTMDAVISQSMGQSTQMEAYIANDLFTDLAGIHVALAKPLSSALVFFWNFLGRKLILYPGKKKQ